MGRFEAIKWAAKLGLCNLVIETDAQMVRDAYGATLPDDSTFGDFVRIGKDLLKENPNYCVNWVCCNANFLPHTLARAARRSDSLNSQVEPPKFVNDLN